LGEKWEEVKKNLLLPSASEHKNLFLLLPLDTKWGSSFLLFKKAKSDHFAFSFLDIIFNSSLERYAYTTFLGRR
jgi:hypothetical protein